MTGVRVVSPLAQGPSLESSSIAGMHKLRDMMFKAHHPVLKLV